MTDFEYPPTLCAGFQATAVRHAGDVALRTPGDAQTLTWRQYADRVAAIAAGLAALGVRRGDTVGLMMSNRPEFHLVDTAALHLGAVPFSIYNTNPPQTIGLSLRQRGQPRRCHRAAVPGPAPDGAGHGVRRAHRPGRRRRQPRTRSGWPTLSRPRPRRASTSRPPGAPSSRPTWRRSSTRRARPGRRRASSSRTRTLSPTSAAPGRSSTRTCGTASSRTCRTRTS